MKDDFTLRFYTNLLKELISSNYVLISLENYFAHNHCKKEKIVLLRHDIDAKPDFALNIAIIENNLGVRSTYYFRMKKSCFKTEIIKEIVKLGHEIGYHYEDFSFSRGDYFIAIELFKKNLDCLRKYYPVKTICMHGSPLSKLDNKDLWKKYNYRDYGIIGEPYFDIDFNEFLYLTDTGRSWNNEAGNIRDKVESNYNFNFISTQDIINSISILPHKLLITTHPQRWTDSKIYWYKELISQKIKNRIKTFISS